jgi:hypothetical protein
MDFPFDESPNVAVMTTRPVMSGASWIANVFHHEDDGGWQFHGVEDPDMDAAMIVALKSVLDLDPSIAEVADLPLGWQAWRRGPNEPWQRIPARGEDD